MSDDDSNKITRLEERLASVTERVKKIEDNQRWIVLLVLGAVVLGVVKLVMVQ